jgi:hypothetical protein
MGVTRRFVQNRKPMRPPGKGPAGIGDYHVLFRGELTLLHNALFFRSAGLLLERGEFLLEHDLVLDRVGVVLPLNP